MLLIESYDMSAVIHAQRVCCRPACGTKFLIRLRKVSRELDILPNAGVGAPVQTQRTMMSSPRLRALIVPCNEPALETTTAAMKDSVCVEGTSESSA